MYIEHVADTYACYLVNSAFHQLIQTKTPNEQRDSLRAPDPSRHFANFFAPYAESSQDSHGRTGTLLEHPPAASKYG